MTTPISEATRGEVEDLLSVIESEGWDVESYKVKGDMGMTEIRLELIDGGLNE